MGKGDFAAARKLLHDNLSFHGPIETFDVKKAGEGAMHTGVDLSGPQALMCLPLRMQS